MMIWKEDNMTIRCLARPEETNPNWNFLTGKINPTPKPEPYTWKYDWEPDTQPTTVEPGRTWNPPDVSQTCLHDQCAECQGTGRKHDGSACWHMISCPCPKCSPSC